MLILISVSLPGLGTASWTDALVRAIYSPPTFLLVDSSSSANNIVYYSQFQNFAVQNIATLISPTLFQKLTLRDHSVQ